MESEIKEEPREELFRKRNRTIRFVALGTLLSAIGIVGGGVSCECSKLPEMPPLGKTILAARSAKNTLDKISTDDNSIEPKYANLQKQLSEYLQANENNSEIIAYNEAMNRCAGRAIPWIAAGMAALGGGVFLVNRLRERAMRDYYLGK